MKKLWLFILWFLLWTSPLYAQLTQTPNLGMYIIPFGYPQWNVPVNDNTNILDAKLPTLNLNCSDGQVPTWLGGKFSLCGSGAGHSIYDELVLRPARTKLRFIGAGVAVTDNAGQDATDVTISGTSLSIGGTGLIVQTAPDTYIARTIACATGQLTCTNGSGVSGNPTLGLGSLAVRTDLSNTWTTGDQNMAGASSFTFPTATGAAPTLSGRCAYDSVGNRLRCGFNGTTVTLATTAEIQPLNANLTQISALSPVNHSTYIYNGTNWALLTRPSCSGANQAINYDAALHIEGCVTVSAAGLSGTTGKLVKFGTTTTGTDSIITESGSTVTVAGGLTIGNGPFYVGFDGSAISGSDKIWTAMNQSGTVRLSTGSFTSGNIVKTDANGLFIDGGAAGTGTWTDGSTNTGTNKTLVATGAGGTNTITTPLKAYWDAGSFTIPAASTCTAAALTQINSGPSAYTITCTDAGTSTFEGNLALPQDIATATFTLIVNDVDSSSQHFAGDFSAMCRNNGTTVNNTWGTVQSVDVTMTTAQNNYTGTTAAVTPNGTCTSGATLFWRFVVNTTPFTDDGDARVIGVLLKQAS